MTSYSSMPVINRDEFNKIGWIDDGNIEDSSVTGMDERLSSRCFHSRALIDPVDSLYSLHD